MKKEIKWLNHVNIFKVKRKLFESLGTMEFFLTFIGFDTKKNMLVHFYLPDNNFRKNCTCVQNLSNFGPWKIILSEQKLLGEITVTFF
jgi:hypothetical protein